MREKFLSNIIHKCWRWCDLVPLEVSVIFASDWVRRGNSILVERKNTKYWKFQRFGECLLHFLLFSKSSFLQFKFYSTNSSSIRSHFYPILISFDSFRSFVLYRYIRSIFLPLLFLLNSLVPSTHYIIASNAEFRVMLILCGIFFWFFSTKYLVFSRIQAILSSPAIEIWCHTLAALSYLK